MKLDTEEFVGLLVHAYNNHLSAMTGFAELCQLEVEPTSEIYDRLNVIVDSGRLATNLGKDLLAVVGRAQLHRQNFNIVHWLEDFLQSHSQKSLVVDRTKTTINKGNSLFVEVDPDSLQRSIEEILLLLVKLGGKTIDFSYSQITQANLEISCKADIKMSDKIDESLMFHPFYSTKNLFGEKGVGLAVVYGLLLQQNCSIKSEINGETLSFVLSIPLEN